MRINVLQFILLSLISSLSKGTDIYSGIFDCGNGQFIDPMWLCDGDNDCGNFMDEKACAGESSFATPCPSNEFRCKSSNRCISHGWRCDGDTDCSDGSDEENCGDPCENKTCAQNCRNTPTGPKCYCNEGYKLDAKNNETCNDIDECQLEGSCSHKCKNSIGNYECSCLNEYELVNRTCRAKGADPLLIFSTSNDIRGIRLRSNRYFRIQRTIQSAAVHVDPKSQQIYWADISSKPSVCSTQTDGSEFRIVLSHGLLVPEDIAVDYIASNLYLTDSGLKQILACKTDGTMCHIIHDKNIEKPYSIVLDPTEGLMYWSDWGEQSAGIYRSGMDGSQRVSLVSTLVGRPNGIALDRTTRRLYWVDAKLNTIECITLDGTSRKVILNIAGYHPYSLVVFEDTIYWSDWSTSSLESCNKFSGHKMTIKGPDNWQRIMGVHLYHPVLTANGANPCLSNDCSHMCLISPTINFTCACPHGFELAVDDKTCVLEHNGASLFVSEGSSVFYISPKSVGSGMLMELPLSLGSAIISRVSYDSNTRRIFVADVKKPAIYAINMTSLHTQVLVNDVDSPEDLALDWMSNNLYWIDSGTRTAEVISIDLLRRVTLLNNLEPPVALAISPGSGFMFIATTGDEPSVTMYDMDGKNPKVLSSVQGMPMSLAHHPTKSILYWADPYAGAISYVTYTGSRDVHVLKTRIHGIMSLATSEEFIYYTSGRRELNLLNGNLTRVLQLPGRGKIFARRKVTYSPSIRTAGMTRCSVVNGGCSYVCLTSPEGRSCACSPGMLLSNDSMTCVARECGDHYFKCMNGNCLPAERVCDGSEDCEDGSDELYCTQW